MHRTVLSNALALAVLAAPLAAQSPQEIPARYREVANRIIAAAQADSAGAWNRIAELSDRFGHRLSGSAALEQAIDWTAATMRADGLDNVRKDKVMVPHWVRGAESLELVAPRRQQLPMLGLGGSIATPPEGITAEVMVVASFEELTQRASDAKGRIVLYDAEWRDYGYNGAFRRQGAIAAAKAGAVASLARSAGPYSMRTPHTGNMSYDPAVPKIPHASVTAEDAMMMRRMIGRGETVRVTLTMNAQMLPDAESANVMGELRGREKPNEIVVMGGHIDSWDVGQGAMDDAGGVVVAWEAVRLLKKLGLTPRRTIRVVGWTNEENGGRGGSAYRDMHQQEPHQLAIESDGGVFSPLGFGFTGSPAARAIVEAIGSLLAPIKASTIGPSGGGADIAAIMSTGVPGMGLTVDGARYFWFHHTDADTPDKLDPAEVQRCVAVMAVMAYIAADIEQSLPR
ncbi:MAG: M20/M25/M40 family metallo-hydrolase [Gemmatimonadaceae bacterium]|jgi:carboxypeptidase Q|nr:M20/M25/M40 family metallo-hydrolase [Gemmatimonadota bacterium]